MTYAAQFREALIRSSGREAPEPRLCMHDPWVTCMHDRRRVTARGVVKTRWKRVRGRARGDNVRVG